MLTLLVRWLLQQCRHGAAVDAESDAAQSFSTRELLCVQRPQVLPRIFHAWAVTQAHFFLAVAEGEPGSVDMVALVLLRPGA